MKRILLTLLTLFSPVSLLFAQVAELENFRSPFYVIRDASSLRVGEPKFLFQDLDVIFSGEDPFSLRLNRFTGVQATLSMSPHSAIFLNISSLKEEQTAQIFLLKGQVDVQLGFLEGRSALLLRTSNLAVELPVTGKVSAVSLTSRDTLIIPLEGQIKVSQSRGNGSSVVIARGMVGEFLDNRLSTRPVSEITLSGYADAWLQIHRPRELDRPERLMRLILTQQAMFARAMGRLRSNELTVWKKWEEEDKNSRMGNPTEVAQDMNSAQGSLISTYPYMIPLLEVLFALEDMPKLSADKQNTKVSSEWTAGDFVRQFPSFSARVKKDIWQYLYWLKLYKKRNKGDFFEEGLPSRI